MAIKNLYIECIIQPKEDLKEKKENKKEGKKEINKKEINKKENKDTNANLLDSLNKIENRILYLREVKKQFDEIKKQKDEVYQPSKI